jgi:hypothetical protein
VQGVLVELLLAALEHLVLETVLLEATLFLVQLLQMVGVVVAQVMTETV